MSNRVTNASFEGWWSQDDDDDRQLRLRRDEIISGEVLLQVEALEWWLR